MRIVFVRHGHPDYARDCLTELGHAQAMAAARRLREEGIEEIYSSPQGRALETAQYAADALDLHPIHILDFMHEITWGSVDGTPIPENGHPWHAADAMAREGFDFFRQDWRDHPCFVNNKAVEETRRVAREIDGWLAAEWGYVREGNAYRCGRDADRERTIALFSHGGSSTAVLAHLFSLPFPYLCQVMRAPFTAVSIIRFPEKAGQLVMPRVEILSDGRHAMADPQGIERD